ncbi:LOW QUALITY PROTEIN: hypothetical protein Cgig2_008326 [Carnegiea gigantea]|uniref:GDSL esterase/lipase n=1 Tax=Carnegiea gigantea TaxID=171969 RepID=A0A9Q1JIE7_9CARY|nr:LOW QUALITY PROTEIN: hypothetical protein Cgig2_008326 [Carnegiea gigantea]
MQRAISLKQQVAYYKEYQSKLYTPDQFSDFLIRSLSNFVQVSVPSPKLGLIRPQSCGDRTRPVNQEVDQYNHAEAHSGLFVGTHANAIQYVFWDGSHPSAAATKLVADDLLTQGLPLIKSSLTISFSSDLKRGLGRVYGYGHDNTGALGCADRGTDRVRRGVRRLI